MADSSALIDFNDIEEGGGARVRVPEGDYGAKVKSVKFATSQAGNPMFIFVIVGTTGKFKGKELNEYAALTKKALWKLRDIIEATGNKVPKKKLSTRQLLDWIKKNVVGQDIGVTLGDDEYVNEKGKSFISSKIQDYMTADDLDDSSDDDEDSDDEDDDDIEEEEGSALDGMTRTELKAYIKSEELDIPVKKSMTDDDLRAAILEEQEGAEVDEEDEDEDDGLDEMDRTALKAYIKNESVDVKVLKKMTDDDIRAAIRAAGDDEEVDLDLDEL